MVPGAMACRDVPDDGKANNRGQDGAGIAGINSTFHPGTDIISDKIKQSKSY